MTTAYTSLLGLALPVTGELSGTWGDTVNNYITQYVDAAVAGATPGSGRQRVDLLVTIDVQSLLGHDDPRLDRAGVDEFGGRIPAHIVRQLAEHASIARILHAGNQVIEHGRAMRLATDADFEKVMSASGNMEKANTNIQAWMAKNCS